MTLNPNFLMQNNISKYYQQIDGNIPAAPALVQRNSGDGYIFTNHWDEEVAYHDIIGNLEDNLAKYRVVINKLASDYKCGNLAIEETSLGSEYTHIIQTRSYSDLNTTSSLELWDFTAVLAESPDFARFSGDVFFSTRSSQTHLAGIACNLVSTPFYTINIWDEKFTPKSLTQADVGLTQYFTSWNIRHHVNIGKILDVDGSTLVCEWDGVLDYEDTVDWTAFIPYTNTLVSVVSLSLDKLRRTVTVVFSSTISIPQNTDNLVLSTPEFSALTYCLADDIAERRYCLYKSATNNTSTIDVLGDYCAGTVKFAGGSSVYNKHTFNDDFTSIKLSSTKLLKFVDEEPPHKIVCDLIIDPWYAWANAIRPTDRFTEEHLHQYYFSLYGCRGRTIEPLLNPPAFLNEDGEVEFHDRVEVIYNGVIDDRSMIFKYKLNSVSSTSTNFVEYIYNGRAVLRGTLNSSGTVFRNSGYISESTRLQSFLLYDNYEAGSFVSDDRIWYDDRYESLITSNITTYDPNESLVDYGYPGIQTTGGSIFPLIEGARYYRDMNTFHKEDSLHLEFPAEYLYNCEYALDTRYVYSAPPLTDFDADPSPITSNYTTARRIDSTHLRGFQVQSGDSDLYAGETLVLYPLSPPPVCCGNHGGNNETDPRVSQWGSVTNTISDDPKKRSKANAIQRDIFKTDFNEAITFCQYSRTSSNVQNWKIYSAYGEIVAGSLSTNARHFSLNQIDDRNVTLIPTYDSEGDVIPGYATVWFQADDGTNTIDVTQLIFIAPKWTPCTLRTNAVVYRTGGAMRGYESGDDATEFRTNTITPIFGYNTPSTSAQRVASWPILLGRIDFDSTFYSIGLVIDSTTYATDRKIKLDIPVNFQCTISIWNNTKGQEIKWDSFTRDGDDYILDFSRSLPGKVGDAIGFILSCDITNNAIRQSSSFITLLGIL